MKRLSFWGLGCFFLLGLLALSGAAWAQTTNGEVRGTVTDPSGAVVPGATITVVQVDTGATRKVTTDKDGLFDVPELPVGTYSVAAEAAGFKKYVANGIVVTIGHVAALSLPLQVGGSMESVTVEANAVQVETTSTQIGGVMTDMSVRELPLSTRNTYELLQLQPGVQSQLGADLFYGSDNPGVVSVNGGRGRSNNYMVNGGDGNDIFVNAPAIQPSPDAIEEFRVLTNTFDAEYGRNSGSIVNVVTKSGTNEVHGDFYEFIRNNALNTRGYFDSTVPDYKQNQFGGTLGGPIRKDKTFIFGSYEGNRLVQGIPSGLVFLPTAAEASGDFSEGGAAQTFAGGVADQNFANVLLSRTGCQQAITSQGGPPIAVGATYSQLFPKNHIPTQCFDPTALALYKNYVAPYGTGTVTDEPNQIERGDQFTVRFDQKFGASQQLSVYYYFDNDHRVDPYSTFQAAGANLPEFGDIFGTRVQQWNISHTWTLGTNAVNEFHFNYFREGQKLLDHPVNILSNVHAACGSLVSPSNCFTSPANPSAGITTNLPGREGVPFISVNGGFTIGNNSEGELPQVGNTFQWTDNYTRIYAKHTFKFGVDVRRQRFDQFLYYNIDGSMSFINSPNADQIGVDPSYAAYPDYFIGAVNSYSQGAAQAEDLRNTAFYLFAQDSYKLKTNVTLNYGLRWELNTPYYDTGNRLQTFRPGAVTTKYPCVLNPANSSSAALIADYGSTNCNLNGPANAVFPTGLVFPTDPGVARGLTATYYHAFAPRIGLAWSPGWTDGWLAKLTGGPGHTSLRTGYGIFYNPIEQLVLEQFSAEPPFGGSAALSNVLFNLPFEFQSGGNAPNPFSGVIQQTPSTPCAYQPGGPKGCVDWSSFRPLLLFGELQPHLKAQYAEQYNLTLERQLSKDMLVRVAYVGTQDHHLLASHDLDYGNPQTCLGLISLFNANPNNVWTAPPTAGGAPGNECEPFGSDFEYWISPSAVIPAGGFQLPYNPKGSTTIPAGTVVGNIAPNGITLVGIRKYSSPQCQPLTGTGCPADGVPVFSNIFAEDTIANSNYNGLQLSVEKSYSHGLLFQASYTFSKAIDQGASFENELNPINFNFTRGLSLLNATNRFVFSPVWELPVPKFSGFKGKALDGWGASAIIIYQTGFPIRIQDTNDDELMTSTFFEDANTPEALGKIQFLNPKNPANDDFYFNTSNITDPTLGTFGNMPHALCCGPAISNTDLVVNKKTAINERWDTEFRAEFYNAFNHTQFSSPQGAFGSSTFGQILSTREASRVMQFALKVMF